MRKLLALLFLSSPAFAVTPPPINAAGVQVSQQTTSPIPNTFDGLWTPNAGADQGRPLWRLTDGATDLHMAPSVPQAYANGVAAASGQITTEDTTRNGVVWNIGAIVPYTTIDGNPPLANMGWAAVTGLNTGFNAGPATVLGVGPDSLGVGRIYGRANGGPGQIFELRPGADNFFQAAADPAIYAEGGELGGIGGDGAGGVPAHHNGGRAGNDRILGGAGGTGILGGSNGSGGGVEIDAAPNSSGNDLSFGGTKYGYTTTGDIGIGENGATVINIGGTANAFRGAGPTTTINCWTHSLIAATSAGITGQLNSDTRFSFNLNSIGNWSVHAQTEILNQIGSTGDSFGVQINTAFYDSLAGAVATVGTQLVNSPLHYMVGQFWNAGTVQANWYGGAERMVLDSTGPTGHLSIGFGEKDGDTLITAFADTFDLFDTGIIQYKLAGAFQTTVGASGAASAPPAQPVKYLKIIDSGGATLVVPAYNPS